VFAVHYLHTQVGGEFDATGYDDRADEPLVGRMWECRQVDWDVDAIADASNVTG
jgi:hypothetical protein